MTKQDLSRQNDKTDPGFPTQFVFLLAIIVLGILGLVLKLVGLF